MAKFHATFSTQEPMNAVFSSSNSLEASFGSIFAVDASNVYINTTEGWNSTPTKIAKKDAVYVYTDYKEREEGVYAPAFKVGDGLAYLIDLPFNYGAEGIEVTEEQIAFWNNKVRAYLDEEDPETLVLTRF